MPSPTENPHERAGSDSTASESVTRCFHELRNRLNSLAMNAGVLASLVPDRERARRFSEQIDDDAGACSRLLAQLARGLSGEGLPGRILLVDDDGGGVDAMRILLELDGHQVQVAMDGATALALALREPPDVVLCDLGLPPPLDGCQVARRLRERGNRLVYLCAYSGHGSTEAVTRALAAGFDAHLSKPSSPQAILAQVRHGLARARQVERCEPPLT